MVLLSVVRLQLARTPFPRISRFSTTIARLESAPVQTKPLPYFVHRTGTNNLPVYEERKSGGSLRQTRIRKLEGNIEALRQQLIEKFELDPKKVYIGSQTKHIVIRNEHMKSQVEEFLRRLKF